MNDKLSKINTFDWYLFTEEVMQRNRYILSKKQKLFLERIAAQSDKRKETIKRGDKYFRGRIGPDPNERQILDKRNEILEAIKPYCGMDIEAPLAHLAVQGRANPRGISYLYLANDVDTVIAELRPWKNATVSIIDYEVIDDIEIIDLTIGNSSSLYAASNLFASDLSEEVIEETTWFFINAAFSKPVSPQFTDFEYIPTQILSELFKNNGANGIKYTSSLSNTQGNNLVIFDQKVVKQGNNGLFKIVNRVQYSYDDYEGVADKIKRVAREEKD